MRYYDKYFYLKIDGDFRIAKSWIEGLTIFLKEPSMNEAMERQPIIFKHVLEVVKAYSDSLNPTVMLLLNYGYNSEYLEPLL